MQSQVYAFLMFIINGFLIGILFDTFRIFRKAFKTSDFITYIEDILFWISSALLLLYSIFKFNNGELRWFIFVGVSVGIAIYLLVFSKIFINTTVYIINVVKKILKFLIIVPIKFIAKLLYRFTYKPIVHLIKCIKHIMSVFKNKIKKMFFNNGNYKNKKDFV